MSVNLAFPINDVYSLIRQAGTIRQLRDPDSSFYHQVSVLNGRIQQSRYNDPQDSLLKGIWGEFYRSLQNYDSARAEASLEVLQQYFPRNPNLEFFGDTDLVKYPDDYAGELPWNGIKESEFGGLTPLYLGLFSHLKLKGELNFNEGVLRDIRMILSRPMGRELIRRILNKMPSSQQCIEIYSSQSSSFQAGNPIQVIRHTLKPQRMIQILPDGHSVTLKSPSFINLAHEFIHLLHELEDERRHDDALIRDPTLHRLDTNREERRTIYGDCGTEHAERCHPVSLISDNGLRAQFSGLLQRITHHSGVFREGDERYNFEKAVQYGISGNILRLLPSIPEEDIDAVIERQMSALSTMTSPNPRAGVDVMWNAASRNRELRRGHYLSMARTPPRSYEEWLRSPEFAGAMLPQLSNPPL